MSEHSRAHPTAAGDLAALELGGDLGQPLGAFLATVFDEMGRREGLAALGLHVVDQPGVEEGLGRRVELVLLEGVDASGNPDQRFHGCVHHAAVRDLPLFEVDPVRLEGVLLPHPVGVVEDQRTAELVALLLLLALLDLIDELIDRELALLDLLEGRGGVGVEAVVDPAVQLAHQRLLLLLRLRACRLGDLQHVGLDLLVRLLFVDSTDELHPQLEEPLGGDSHHREPVVGRVEESEGLAAVEGLLLRSALAAVLLGGHGRLLVGLAPSAGVVG